jgi:hypothetical protein
VGAGNQTRGVYGIASMMRTALMAADRGPQRVPAWKLPQKFTGKGVSATTRTRSDR